MKSTVHFILIFPFFFSLIPRPLTQYTASQRLRVANSYKADAEKILLVKAAEADMESKHLTGVGIAKQRKALVDGLQDTVSEFAASVLHLFLLHRLSPVLSCSGLL
jgi:hypothetical protein